MSQPEDLRTDRERKIERVRELGFNPYPSQTERTHDVADVLEQFDTLLAAGQSVSVAGRVMAWREHGAIAFMDVFDGTGKIQAFCSKEEMGDSAFTSLLEVVSTGDFVSVTGVVYVTKRGTQAVLVRTWSALSKALQNIPTEHFGIKDEDERFRKRYLDLLLNPEVRDIAYKRAKFWQAVRQFHINRGFLEVHTPTLEVTTGGGDATPFATHHNALDLPVYLRISAGELWQKRLMVAGFPKTFEVGRIFRNEGMSAEHAQEYEQCEAYWAYADWRMMATFMRECYQYVAQETFGTLQFSIRGFAIDLAGEWPEIDYATVVQEKTGIDIWTATEDTMRVRLAELGVQYSGADNRARLIDTLWKYCRKQIAGPAILINEPKLLSPLAKTNPSDNRVVERFHFIIAGSEVGQGYSELNDPVDQRARFAAQQALRDAGDTEAQMADWEFVEALEYGMPPTAGHGFSERLLAFLLDKPIREIQLFPLMRPKLELKVETNAFTVNGGATKISFKSESDSAETGHT